jgi:hypothetical protein
VSSRRRGSSVLGFGSRPTRSLLERRRTYRDDPYMQPVAPVERVGPPASPIGTMLIIFFIMFMLLCAVLFLFT